VKCYTSITQSNAIGTGRQDWEVGRSLRRHGRRVVLGEGQERVVLDRSPIRLTGRCRIGSRFWLHRPVPPRRIWRPPWRGRAGPWDTNRMRWTVHSEKSLYTDPWLDIRMADVELPDGRHLAHRVIRTPPGAGAVVTDGQNRVLLWRHRFITDTWGWKSPSDRPNRARTWPPPRHGKPKRKQAGAPDHCGSCCGSSRHRVSPPRYITCSAPVAQPRSGGQISSGTTLAALLYTLAQDGWRQLAPE
jgi:hypothetical protein